MSLSPITVVPAVPQFEFRVGLPDGWRKVDVPDIQPDFANLSAFLSLGLFVDDATMSVCSVAARPGYSDGTILEWSKYLAGEQGFQVEEHGPFETAAGTGVATTATQANDGGPTRLRVIALEDGGNLFTITVMTPVEHWDRMHPLLDAVARSFELRHQQGQTVPLRREDGEVKNALGVKTAADMAIATDASSLDPEHPINAAIRDAGRGLVPRVLEIDEAARSATVAAAAIAATFSVPLGWHVMDDGRRTLVFDAGNVIQVNFELIESDPAGAPVVFNSILGDLARENPELKHAFLDLAPDTPALVVRGLVIGGEALEQAYALKPIAGRPGTLLKARVTATAEHLTRAGDLLEVLLKDMKFVG